MKNLTVLIVVVALTLVAGGCGGSYSSKPSDNSGSNTVKKAAPKAKADWSYSGKTGPKFWGSLNPEYVQCSKGKSQSPIDLTGTTARQLPKIQYSYGDPTTVVQEDNGHSVEAEVKAGSSITVDGKKYDLIQFHYHAPSEHTVNGKKFPMEWHFVHSAKDGKHIVVAAFVKEGKENPAFANLVKSIPAKEGLKKDVKNVDLAKLVAPNTGKAARYSYGGSLTTPPCTEGVQFNIYSKPIELSAGQIAAYKSVHNNNDRPVQSRNGRTVDLSQ